MVISSLNEGNCFPSTESTATNTDSTITVINGGIVAVHFSNSCSSYNSHHEKNLRQGVSNYIDVKLMATMALILSQLKL